MSDEHEQIALDFHGSGRKSEADETDLRRRAECAIGEYLSRGRRIWSDMPIARILKALERQGISADEAPRALELIGAIVISIPDYVAKYNHRVTFTQEVLDRCRQVFRAEDEA